MTEHSTEEQRRANIQAGGSQNNLNICTMTYKLLLFQIVCPTQLISYRFDRKPVLMTSLFMALLGTCSIFAPAFPISCTIRFVWASSLAAVYSNSLVLRKFDLVLLTWFCQVFNTLFIWLALDTSQLQNGFQPVPDLSSWQRGLCFRPLGRGYWLGWPASSGIDTCYGGSCLCLTSSFFCSSGMWSFLACFPCDGWALKLSINVYCWSLTS